MNFKNGDRVILVQKGYIPTPDYPVWGSTYGCVGYVMEVNTQISTGQQRVYIKWDNGRSRNFNDGDLAHAESQAAKLDPNIAFSAKKFRR